MKYTGYALQNGFSSYICEHPDILEELSTFTTDQQKHVVCEMDENELWRRAVTYFNNDTITLKDHILTYEHPLRKTTYKMKVEPLHITLYEQDGNPFLPFLKRIFRKFLICEKKESE